MRLTTEPLDLPLASPFRISRGEPLTVTISIGVAATLAPDDTADALIRRSDEALYAAKASGRNVVIAKAA